MPPAHDPESQCADAVLMIRPVQFAGNPQTAESNRFQHSAPHCRPRQAAAREFEALAGRLADAGVKVHAFDDTPQPHTPDSIFPNNWVSFHADGTVVLYPMLAPNPPAGAPPRSARDAQLAGSSASRVCST